MTMAKTITEKNGHSSQPSKPQDTRNKARKNHNIMSRGDDGLKLPPQMIGFPVAYPLRGSLRVEIGSKKSHGTNNH